jgi:transcription initiation factor TFIID subunit TAF12
MAIHPIRGTLAGCCACAPSGQSVAGAAKAPPSIEMNSRRRMCPRALNHSRLRNGNVDETAHNQPRKPIRLNIC